jgi:hypothetical protein
MFLLFEKLKIFVFFLILKMLKAFVFYFGG